MIEKAAAYLQKLCVEIPSRRVGSEGNRAATDFFAATMASLGLETEFTEFDCMDWTYDIVRLVAHRMAFEAYPSPYSIGCNVKARLIAVTNLAELEALENPGEILLLRGELAKEQLMPKSFPFFNPDEHRYLIGLLEQKKPSAIIAATSRDVAMVGSQYPFPMFEDGDFDIPSVYMREEDGEQLAEYSGAEIALESRAWRLPAKGCNVIARKEGSKQNRIVLFAHIDARMGSPGANDNASGVIVLLLLAELLKDYQGGPTIELVAMNGEDYYSNPGEQLYLAQNSGRFKDIMLGINLDDVGFHKGKVAYSLYHCPEELARNIREVFAGFPGMIEGEAWYQGDHGLFLMNNVPALAITSELLKELMAEFTHTPKDTPEIVDPGKLVDTARALHALLSRN